MRPSTSASAPSDAGTSAECSPTSGGELALVAAGVLLVSAAALSGSDVLSAILAGAAIVIGAWPVAFRMRRCLPAQLACAVAVFWLGYAAVLGALPSLGDAGEVSDWATAEGRAFLALFAITVGASFRSQRAVSDLVRWIVAVVAVSLLVGFISHWFHVGPPPFDHRPRQLFHGLTSSHHVAGFLGMALVMVVVATPGLFHRWMRVALVVIGVVAIALTGSRSSLVGLGVGIVVVLAHLLDRGRLVRVVVILLAGVALLVVPVPRFRETVEVIFHPEFVGDAAAAFDDGTKQGARRLSESTVEANMLIRFALWGEQFDVVRSSPVLGIGRFRGNDDNVEMWGVDGLLNVVVDGVRSPAGQPHNIYLFLLGETGVVGLLIFASPYVVALRRTRRPQVTTAATLDEPGDVVGVDDSADGSLAWTYWVGPGVAGIPEPTGWRALCRGLLAVGLTIGFFSASLMTTGLGLIVNLLVFGAAAAHASAMAANRLVEREELS